MSLVNIIIDGVSLRADAQSTILDAAQQAGIHIPSLCHHPDYSVRAVCRVCMVESNGKPVPACATTVSEGMSVKTKGARIEGLRKTSLELILSHHPMECQHCARNGVSEVADLSDEMCGYCRFCDCVKDGVCELQELAKEMNVTFGDFTWTERREAADESTPSIIKDPNKCILCRRCVDACGKQQGIHAWSIAGRGEEARIEPAFGMALSQSNCVQCGQCVQDCPTGALSPKQQADDLFVITDNKDTTVIAWLHPNFLPEFSKLGEYGELDITEQHIVAGLHRVGIDIVWQGADIALTALRDVMGELESSKEDTRTLVGYSDYAAKTLSARLAPEGRLSRSLSAQQQFGRFAKGAWAKSNQKDPGRIYAIALTASLSGKAEAECNDSCGVDLALTPIEVRRLFYRRGADLSLLAPEAFDLESKAASLPALQPKERGVTELTRNGGGKIAVAQGLEHAQKLLDEVNAGTSEYDLIYLSALPGEGIDIRAVM